MNEQQALELMKGPGDHRPVWRGGVMQIHVTRACDMACFGCTQGSNLAGKPVMITLEQFEEACISLRGYFGVVGMFGGNPTMHPQFEDLCKIMRKHIPFEQRGLWCNNLRGKGKAARITFNPHHSNLNVHLNTAAFDEFCRDWPETVKTIRKDSDTGNLKGRDRDARHGPPFVAAQDVIKDPEERWSNIARCDVNQYWSAMLYVFRGKLRAAPCELMGAISMLHQNNPNWNGTGQPMPDYGIDPVEGWWRERMTYEPFANAVRNLCHACGMPNRSKGELAVTGTTDQYSKTHAFIFKMKNSTHKTELVQLRSQLNECTTTKATNYMEKGDNVG